MEVIRLRAGEQGDGGRPRDDRERLVASIMERPVGIFGTEVCQLCGELGTFSGWVTAWASHHRSEPRSREFADPRHGHGPHAEREAALARQPHRFCEVCGRQVTREERLPTGKRLCAGCRSELEDAHRGADLTEVLAALARRRYLEQKTTEELRSLDLNLAAAAFDEELNRTSGLERLALEASRGQRAREELRRLSELHGIDYLADG
jgi:hypothetical protein